MNVPATEDVTCVICGSNDSTLLFADKRLSPSGKKGIVRCTKCGLVYRNIRMSASDIREYYEKNYQNQSNDWAEGKQDHYKSYMNLITSFRKHNRILDLGAGQGFFLALCKGSGWDCYGIEPSIERCRFASDHFGLHLSKEVLDDGQYEDDFFDVVTFWNVLEVIPDPIKTLSLVYRILRPGGAVLIRCINAPFHIVARRTVTAAMKISPKFSALNHSVFHPNNFDRQTLVHMLSMTHFDDIRVTPAKLSWTTTYDASSDIFKKSASKAIDGISRIFYWMTAGEIISPSLLAIALKPVATEND